jgi:hypothetical protein
VLLNTVETTQSQKKRCGLAFGWILWLFLLRWFRNIFVKRCIGASCLCNALHCRLLWRCDATFLLAIAIFWATHVRSATMQDVFSLGLSAVHRTLLMNCGSGTTLDILV